LYGVHLECANNWNALKHVGVLTIYKILLYTLCYCWSGY